MNNASQSYTDLKFTMNLKLWESLFKGKSTPVTTPVTAAAHKLSKADAFYDLLCRKRLFLCTNDETFTHVSQLALANAWGWNRTAVVNFCNELQSLGVLTITRTSKSSFVELSNIVCLDDNTDVRSAEAVFYEFLMYKIVPSHGVSGRQP